MISKQRSLFFCVGDSFFKTLDEAQRFDLQLILKPTDFTDEQSNAIVDFLMKNAAAVVDILTTTPTSRAKARKTNGSKKTLKAPKRPKLQPAELLKE